MLYKFAHSARVFGHLHGKERATCIAKARDTERGTRKGREKAFAMVIEEGTEEETKS